MSDSLDRFIYLLTNRLCDKEKEKQVKAYKEIINKLISSVKSNSSIQEIHEEFNRYIKKLLKISMVSNEQEIYSDVIDCFNNYANNLKNDPNSSLEVKIAGLNPSERLVLLRKWKEQKINSEKSKRLRLEEDVFIQQLNREIERYKSLITSAKSQNQDKQVSQIEKRIQKVSADLIFLIDHLNWKIMNSSNSKSTTPSPQKSKPSTPLVIETPRNSTNAKLELSIKK